MTTLPAFLEWLAIHDGVIRFSYGERDDGLKRKLLVRVVLETWSREQFIPLDASGEVIEQTVRALVADIRRRWKKHGMAHMEEGVKRYDELWAKETTNA